MRQSLSGARNPLSSARTGRHLFRRRRPRRHKRTRLGLFVLRAHPNSGAFVRLPPSLRHPFDPRPTAMRMQIYALTRIRLVRRVSPTPPPPSLRRNHPRPCQQTPARSSAQLTSVLLLRRRRPLIRLGICAKCKFAEINNVLTGGRPTCMSVPINERPWTRNGPTPRDRRFQGHISGGLTLNF